MKNALIALMVAMAVCGCTTVAGNAAINDEAKVASIRPGKSTMKDVQAAFGEPSHVEIEKDGSQVWTYQNVSSEALAYVPLLNLTGNYQKEKKVVIRFDNKGKVVNVGRGTQSF